MRSKDVLIDQSRMFTDQIIYKFFNSTVSEFIEFKLWLKSAKNRFKLCAGLNLKKFNTIQVEPTIFKPRPKFKPWLNIFKFGLRTNKLCKSKVLN